MSRLPFSMATMIAAVFVIAVGCAALRFANDFWAGTLFTAALIVLLYALLALIVRRGSVRLFWAGFALFGWVYMLLTVGPWFSDHVRESFVSPTLLRLLHARLATPASAPAPSSPGQLVAWLRTDGTIWINGQATAEEDLVAYFQQIKSGQRKPELLICDYDPSLQHLHTAVRDAAFKAGLGGYNGIVLGLSPDLSDFERVGQSLFTILFALRGGVVARVLLAPGNSAARSNDQ